ncbi:MAG: oligosaccharide flippase family protein [Candidatus Aenigmatarchaeota archaeon]
MKREIALKTGLIGGWSITAAVISFIFTLLVSNTLGPADYGLFVLSMSVFELGLVFFYGINDAGTKYIAETRLRCIAKKVATMEIIIGIIMAAVLFFGADFIAGLLGKPIGGYLRIVAIALAIRPGMEVLKSVYLGMKRMKLFVTVLAINDIGRLIFAAVAFALGFGVGGVLWGLVAAIFLSFIIASFGLKKNGLSPGYFETRKLVNYSLRSFTYFIFLAIYAQITYYMVGAFLPAEEVGIFGLIFKLIVIGIGLIPAAVNTVLFPYFSELSTDEERTGKLLSASLTITTVTATFMCVVMFLLLGHFVRLLFPAYSEGLLIVPILIAGSFINVISSTTDSLVKGRGDFRIGITSAAAAIAVLAVSGYYMIPAYGLTGAALTWFFGSVTVNVLFLLQIRKKHDLHFDIEVIYRMVAITVGKTYGLFRRSSQTKQLKP